MGLKFIEFSELMESNKSLKHEFKDPVSYVCLASAVVASWSLTQEMAGLNHFTVMTNICRKNSNTGRSFPIVFHKLDILSSPTGGNLFSAVKSLDLSYLLDLYIKSKKLDCRKNMELNKKSAKGPPTGSH